MHILLIDGEIVLAHGEERTFDTRSRLGLPLKYYYDSTPSDKIAPIEMLMKQFTTLLSEEIKQQQHLLVAQFSLRKKQLTTLDLLKKKKLLLQPDSELYLRADS